MSQTPKRYTITAALPYANGPIHIGHLAGCYLPADIYARYQRLNHREVAFMCGSDEHGVAITIKAKKEGVTPQEIVDKYHVMMQDSLRQFGISFDHYSRTSSPTHKQTAQDFFKNLYDKGEFLEKTTQQYFDEEAQQFLADRYIEGTCPKCGYEHAYGDQCESCGTSLSPTELINPVSKLSGNQPVLRDTTHWFLALDRHTEWLKKWIVEGHKSDWKSNVYGQCKSWLEAGEGLQPRSMTRDLDWGVPVPVEGADGKVLYVWFDAPIGYISATREWAEQNHKDWEPFWMEKDTKLVHFIGKDNIVFHCIIFPAILKTHGAYILPDNVPANEFLNLEGQKISTSRNWAVWLHEYLEDFSNKQDVLRYVLCATAPETKDNDFTWKDFQQRNNSELVAIYGNFVNRVLVLMDKYYSGVVPQMGACTAVDTETLAEIQKYPQRIGDKIEAYKFRDGLQELMNLARLGNKYLADEEPWKTIKTDPQRAATVLAIAAQIAGALSVLSEPFMPFVADSLRNMLNLEPQDWSLANMPLLPANHQMGKANLLFDKVEDVAIAAQLEKLEAQKALPSVAPANAIPEAKENIAFDDFQKMDLRVAVVLEAERVKKTDKLIKLTVNTGLDTRTVVSGIAQWYTPEELVGKRVVLLANLAPRKIKGIESQGMILLGEDHQGNAALVEPDTTLLPGACIS
ncbi:MAG: methionine--tRNA ligase [Schleiferiaceae bacterium]|nr:methionine--tRNA ligase [Schleiferiaceae bacterium]